MTFEILFNSEVFTYLVIPVLIFLARIFDVSIGTLRIIFTNRGYKFLSSVLGFFEVLVWLLAITKIMQNLTNIYCYIAYALGFATGTYIGIVLEERISLGIVNVRVISHLDSRPLLKKLKGSEFTYVSAGADSPDGKVNMINSVVSRKDMHKVIDRVMEIDPNAFYTIEDIKFVREFGKTPKLLKHPKKLFSFTRKGK